MSVDFTQPPSSASIPDASETVKGKIRIATSAEATAGTDDLTAMTPLKVQSVVNTALVGGVTYQGTFDASSPADLSNASKGDLYIISVAGTYQGQTWAVGDHLLINADMGGTLDPSKIDKVDNTDAVTSVAGRTGAVTLELNDLTDVTFTAGSGIDNYVLTYNNATGLWGAEASKRNFYSLAVGNNASYVADTDNVCKYYRLFNGGITLTIPNAASNNVIGGLVIIRNTSTSTNTVVCPSANLADGTTVTTFDLEPEEARSFVWTSTSTWEEISSSSLGQLSDVDLTGLSNGDVLSYNSTSGKWEAGTSPAPSIALNDLTDVTITGAATGEVLRYNGTAWVDAQLAYSDLSGTPTLATVATTGAYSDLSGTPTNVSTFTNDAGYLTDITGENLGDLSDVDVTGVSNGDVIAYNSTSGNWEATAQSGAPAASETVAGILEIATNAEATAGIATDKALVPSNISSITTAQLNNSAGTFLEAANNLSDLANAATARTNLGLATVANTGAYSDLSGTPTLGTSAALDVGTSANNVVQLDGSAKLPAVDGSQLTNLPAPSIALNDLTDVTITGVATGEVLRYNGTAWVDAQLAYTDLSGTPTLATVATTGAYSDLTGAPTNVSSFTNDAGYLTNITGENLGDLADVDLTGLSDGEIIIYNATSGNWEANPPPAPAATETSVGLIEIATNAEATAGTATDKALVPSNISSITTAQLDNSAGTMLEAANNLSDLANTATARTNLGLGTAATQDVGTSAGNVVQLNGSAQLPALDGSLLTGVVADISGASIGDLSDVSITSAATGEVLRYNGTAWVDAQLNYTDLAGSPPLPSISTLTTSTTLTAPTSGSVLYVRANSSSAITITLPAASSRLGYKYEIKQIGTGALTIAAPSGETIDGASSHSVGTQYESRTVVAIAANTWEIY